MAGRQLQLPDLPLKPVDPNSPVPLYHQIEQDLRGLIKSGYLLPEDVLPTEMELCRAYGVGRHTMRMALSRLAADGLIMRHAGRGTFVRSQPGRKLFYLDRSFTRQMAEMGLETHSRVLDQAVGIINSESPKPLSVKIGFPYFSLVRLRYGGDEPVGLQSTVILTHLCPGLEHFDFNRLSLYDVLANEYHLPITEITHVVSAVNANRVQADMLRVSEGDALLLVNTTAYVGEQDIIEYTTSYYRADKYEYSTTHTFAPV